MADGAETPFPPIGDYGFLSDCHTGALVAPDGSIEWLCLPRFDSPSVLTAILDRGAGSFRFGPCDISVPLARRYVPGTNIIESTWMCDGGWVVVRDALTLAEWDDKPGLSHVRAPISHDAEQMVLRTAECISGAVEIELVCDLAYGYGLTRPSWSLSADGTAAHATGEGPDVRLLCDRPLEIAAGAATSIIRLEEGESCFCGLAWGDDGRDPASVEEASARLDTTSAYWRRWLADGRFPDHPWRIYLQRSALALKGLTYAPTGALLAALTSSLPETPHGERNWDYRFTWVRDATFALWGLHTLGFDHEARDFVEFVRDVCHLEESGEMQIMYGIGGERDLPESTLDHLGGYEGARPVRIGNAAHSQRQNDVYGALLDSVYINTKSEDRLLDRGWEIVKVTVEDAVGVWREPDQGIWEARGDPKHYVSSKIMCWVALDRGAKLARRRAEEAERAERWAGIANEIKDDILERGVSERGVMRQHYETDALDASLLLAPLLRFLPPYDERIRSTVLAIADDLTVDGLVLRYKVDETDDGLSGEEGTFTICSFWLVSALSEIGELDRARELCDRLLSFAGPLNLYAEEIEPRSGTQLGNFPQAFTHLALINAVSHVIVDELTGRKADEASGVFSGMQALRG